MQLIKVISKEDLKIFKDQRLKTFEYWRLDHEEDAFCTSERLASAGFYSTANSSYPDATKCAFCGQEIEWDKEDDPWQV